jgi:predicted  nucleic acid-binding Zn-ribbon protein
MDKLNAVRSGIQASVQSKEQFANYLKNRLQEINTGLKQLADLINELKNKTDNLQSQISTNNANMGDKERQLQELSKQLENLNIERNDLIAKMSQQDNATKNQMAEMAELQKQIDNYQVQLRDLNQLSVSQKGELDALRQEMSRTGDERDKAHVEELARLTQESTQQLEQQEAQLMQKIKECESKLIGFEQQIRDKDTQFINKQREIEEKMIQTRNSGTALQTEIANLRSENEGLVQRLIAATNAINQSADDLQMLMADIPNAQSKQEIETLLNSISEQMGQSIKNISLAAQGQNIIPQGQNMMPPGQPIMQPAPPMMPQGEPMMQQGEKIKPNTRIRGMTYQNLLTGLTEKASKDSNDPKFRKALREMQGINDVRQIEQILRDNKINISQNFLGSKVFGGNKVYGAKKIKRTMKQKGGFIYGKNTKRRSITSKQKSQKTSRKTSRRH